MDLSMESDAGQFGLWISILNRRAYAYFQKKLGPLGIGPGRQAYLLALKPGEVIRQEELALRLRVDKANVSRAVEGLVRSGFVGKAQSPDDGRAWNISLTRKGSEIRGEVENISGEWIRKLQSALSEEEWNRMEEYMKKIAEAAVEMI